MSILGLSWEEAKARCPPEIVPACHNSADNVTVSGPPEAIAKFVKLLQAEGIFAKEVKSSGVAFHSQYIAEAAPKLRKYLERVSFILDTHTVGSYDIINKLDLFSKSALGSHEFKMVELNVFLLYSI